MDAATATQARPATSPCTQPVNTPPVVLSPAKTTWLADLLAAWPRSAQVAGVLCVGAMAALLGVNALSYLRSGAKPSELSEARPITYRVDLNEARQAELLQVPGIGPALANRIDEYRTKHGGFSSVDDLRKVSGIGLATLERLRPYLTVKKLPDVGALASAAPTSSPVGAGFSVSTGLIDVNSASLTDLDKLPGIGPVLAKRIVDEREKRSFTSVDDLRRVPGIGPKTLEKIRPFVTVGVK